MNPLAWMNPGRWLLYLGLVVALLLGARVLEARIEARGDAAGYARAQAEFTAASLAAEQAHRAREQELQAQVNKAVEDAKKRETQLARDVAAVRRERDGLRDDLAAARDQLPTASLAALREHARTLNVLLQQCSADLEGMARTADAHAADTLMLLEAWPR